MINFELDVVVGILTDMSYAVKILPHIVPEHFRDDGARLLFDKARRYFMKYGALADKNVLQVEVVAASGKVSDELIKKALGQIEGLNLVMRERQWLIDRTEEFGKAAEFYNAASQTMAIISGDEKKIPRERIPELFRTALAFTLEAKAGYDYFDEAGNRWEFYNSSEDRILFDLEEFNQITKGGLPRKTLTCPMAGTNVGKSALLTSLTADWARRGFNVLYVSGEMMRERIAERIDANFLKIAIDDLKTTPKDFFTGEIARVAMQARSRIIIEEFPTGSGDVIQIENLMDNLDAQKRFIPDLLVVDYLGVFRATRSARDAGMYERGKWLAEEMRGLAVKRNIPVVSPVQTNRGGQDSSNPDFGDMAESHGVSQVCDEMFALVRTDQMREEGRVLVKRIKSRFTNVDFMKKFVLGFDPERQTFYSGVDQTMAGNQKKGGLPPTKEKTWTEIQDDLAKEGELF